MSSPSPHDVSILGWGWGGWETWGLWGVGGVVSSEVWITWAGISMACPQSVPWSQQVGGGPPTPQSVQGPH